MRLELKGLGWIRSFGSPRIEVIVKIWGAVENTEKRRWLRAEPRGPAACRVRWRRTGQQWQ